MLAAALGPACPYVGAGRQPQARRGRGRLACASDASSRARVRTPAGLDIGATDARRRSRCRSSPRSSPPGRARQGVRVPAEVRSGRPKVPRDVAIDPVCGMSVATVEASLHLDHDGVRWWFCGSGCLRAFADDPGRYTRILTHVADLADIVPDVDAHARRLDRSTTSPTTGSPRPCSARCGSPSRCCSRARRVSARPRRPRRWPWRSTRR